MNNTKRYRANKTIATNKNKTSTGKYYNKVFAPHYLALAARFEDAQHIFQYRFYIIFEFLGIF
ncbi:hypothetical protein Q6344_11340 [Psychrobacter cibarius]|nr:hypothetical protein Q6344_11340 [Psychrobacter cibarius]